VRLMGGQNEKVLLLFGLDRMFIPRFSLTGNRMLERPSRARNRMTRGSTPFQLTAGELIREVRKLLKIELGRLGEASYSLPGS
jgi:hypothetical protein